MAPQLKLYFVPFTRSTRARWVLEEIGRPYELIKLDPAKGDTKQESYRKLHPLGHVPALVDGDRTLIESAAICMYLADKFPEANLAPPIGSELRGEYYQWIVFAMTTVEPAITKFAEIRNGKAGSSELSATKKRLDDVLAVLDAHLRSRVYLVGGQFSSADVILASMLVWGGSMGLLHPFPALQSYAQAMVSRPAAQKARG